jgi:hypothetical protein
LKQGKRLTKVNSPMKNVIDEEVHTRGVQQDAEKDIIHQVK